MGVFFNFNLGGECARWEATLVIGATRNIVLSVYQLDNDIKSKTVDDMSLLASYGWWLSQGIKS